MAAAGSVVADRVVEPRVGDARVVTQRPGARVERQTQAMQVHAVVLARLRAGARRGVAAARDVHGDMIGDERGVALGEPPLRLSSRGKSYATRKLGSKMFPNQSGPRAT